MILRFTALSRCNIPRGVSFRSTASSPPGLWGRKHFRVVVKNASIMQRGKYARGGVAGGYMFRNSGSWDEECNNYSGFISPANLAVTFDWQYHGDEFATIQISRRLPTYLPLTPDTESTRKYLIILGSYWFAVATLTPNR